MMKFLVLLIQISFFYNEVKRDITSVVQKIDLMYEWNTSSLLAAKSNLKQCKHTRLRYTLPLPLPGGIPTTIAYIKGLQAVNRLIFRLYMLTPNKVTPNTRKSKISAILCHFHKQLQQRKSLDRPKSINLLRLIFSF